MQPRDIAANMRWLFSNDLIVSYSSNKECISCIYEQKLKTDVQVYDV